MRFEKGKNMFKLGDTVTIKNLTDAERAQYPYYNTIMKEYEQQMGQITRISHMEYVVEYTDRQKWYWPKEWIKPATVYDAF